MLKMFYKVISDKDFLSTTHKDHLCLIKGELFTPAELKQNNVPIHLVHSVIIEENETYHFFGKRFS